MDRLEEIFALQKKLNDDIIVTRQLQGITDAEWMQKYLLAMLSEMAELLDEINYKWWKNAKPVNELAVKEELVDILHFFVSMCIKSGMTAEEMHMLYLEKNKENHLRQQGKGKKSGYSLSEDRDDSPKL
ncbi:MAG: dUTPase [Eubacteriales bacterium]|nr:dUTPase [Eubacteriales bacterium]MDD4105468.1 dUTPase [Eubacteriales bacterium]MDD4710696.1 dUTPase [Eubacteriales bacterium]NLO16416.1 dUTPase [Clostridiales bacterium]